MNEQTQSAFKLKPIELLLANSPMFYNIRKNSSFGGLESANFASQDSKEHLYGQEATQNGVTSHQANTGTQLATFSFNPEVAYIRP